MLLMIGLSLHIYPLKNISYCSHFKPFSGFNRSSCPLSTTIYWNASSVIVLFNDFRVVVLDRLLVPLLITCFLNEILELFSVGK